MKCKKQVEIQNGINNKTKNGRDMIKGKCGKCDTTVCRFISTKVKDSASSKPVKSAKKGKK